MQLQLKQAMTQRVEKGASLQLRLFFWIISLLLALIACVTLLLFASGVFEAGKRELRASFDTELTYLSDQISSDYGNISLRSVALSEDVSKEIEIILIKNGIKPSDLAAHPEMINRVLNGVFNTLLTGLKNCEGGGVMIVLDATVNPQAENAADSRAGIGLHNMEAGTSSVLYYDIRYVRGPAAVAREHGMTSLPQWKMEFDISAGDYFTKTVNTARQSDTPLSRLYYWTAPIHIAGSSESTMICCVPLIASDGTIMGVVGYSVNSTLFRSSYAPSENVLSGTFLKLVPKRDDAFDMSRGLYAGKYHLLASVPDGSATASGAPGGFTRFHCENSDIYEGAAHAVQLYPDGSPYENEAWSVMLMAPEQSIETVIAEKNRSIILLLLLLLILFTGTSYFLSHRYLRPVKKAFHAIQSDSLSSYSKTRIPEIDDLMEFLATQDKLIQDKDAAQKEVPMVYDQEKYENFVQHIQELTPAEKAVFDLYLEGLNAQQITKRLHLSINTIKTHNRHIYMKLDVASRKELLIYAKVMQQKNV